MSNKLQNEKSPYLLQHKDNPVYWYPWCGEAFCKAKEEEKPIFLSIGYSTCHWCHVMAEESFEDKEIAKLLNQNFISIKVDREERPDIDAVYMSVCQMLTGSGGWPLTIIMTPDQKPFFAGTYFPKRQRYGRAGLWEILHEVVKLWKVDKERLLCAGEEITSVLVQKQTHGEGEPERDILHKACRLYRHQFDPQWGGFGQAPKFPSPHNIMFLLRYGLQEKSVQLSEYADADRERAVPSGRKEYSPDEWKNGEDAWEMALFTLDRIAEGGIFDQVGGGFSRYSTDKKWLVPHFEKMLYDNALFIQAYLDAYQISSHMEPGEGKRALYADIVRRTADYILHEMTDDKGGFYCGQDADSDGEEGKYYVFTLEEITGILGEKDGKEFCRLYNVTEEGNFEGKSIPNRIGQKSSGWKKEDPRLKALYACRMERTHLHKDDKILLSWNAWTIIALAQAGRILESEQYLQAAEKAQQFIETYMADEKKRLYLRFCNGEAAYQGQLDDYAVYALALLELYRTTFRTEYLENAIFRAEQMEYLFRDEERGGYYATAADAEALLYRPKETYDGALPSGNSAAAMLLQRLAALTGEEKWQEAADRQLRFMAGEAEEYPAGYSFTLLAMLEVLYPHRELVCTVKTGIPQKLRKYLKENLTYNLQVLVKTEETEETLSVYAPYTKAYPLPEHGAVYYFCENGACTMPVNDPAKLRGCTYRPEQNSSSCRRQL